MRFVRVIPWMVAGLLAGCLRGYHEGPDIDAADVIAVDTARDVPPSDTGTRDSGCGAVNVATDPHNCGLCGHDCTTLPQVINAASVSCQAGACVLPPSACAPGYLHCVGTTDNGCETAIDQAMHCGGCGMTCSGSMPYCVATPAVADGGTDGGADGSVVDAGAMDAPAGDAVALDGATDGAGGADAAPFNPQSLYTYACVGACPATAAHMCTGPGTCTDFQTDPLNCGGCQQGCRVPANGYPTCMGGNCGAPQCLPGFHVCGSDCADDHAVATCGAACMPCPLPMHAIAATCDGTACGAQCEAGYVFSAGMCVPFTDPQLISPLSVSLLNTDQPTLVVQMPMGETSARIDLCDDRACTMVTASHMVSGTGRQPATFTGLAQGAHFWRATTLHGAVSSAQSSPTWEFIVPPLPAGRTMAVPTAAMGFVLDFDGDGLTDLLIHDNRGLRVDFGTPTGVSDTTVQMISAPFGTTVSAAGDVDGDGFADIVSASTVCHGQADRTTTPHCTSLPTGGSQTWGIGDFDGDGFGDVMNTCCNAPFSSPSLVHGPDFTRTNFLSVGQVDGCSAAGDLDADGLADFACSSGQSNALWVFLGSATAGAPSPHTIPLGFAGLFGRPSAVVGGARDLNGDGRADLLVLAVTDSLGTGEQPSEFVCLGAATVGCLPQGTVTPPFGTAGAPGGGSQPTELNVAGPGDFDGDGYADVVFAVQEQYVVGHGSASGSLTFGSVGGIPRAGTTGRSDDLTGGDFDGDHLSDLVVADPFAFTVNVYVHGGASGTPLSAAGSVGNTSISAIAR